MKRYSRIPLCALFNLAAMHVRAADGRIPIASVPYTISAPGVYYLTQDLNGAGGTAITISASPVTLDLNGHAITNAVNAVSANNQAQVTIRSGTITATSRTVFIAVDGTVARSSFRVENVTSIGGTIWITSSVANPMEIRVTGNTVTGAAGGIVISHANAGDVTGNQVNGCISSNSAIELDNSSNLDISRNSVNCQAGLSISSTTGSHVHYNVISGSTGFSFYLSGFSGSPSSRNSVEHNTVTGTTGAGPFSGNGIVIGSYASYNAITANHVAGNAQYGLYFDTIGTTGNIYSGNTISGNTLGGVSAGTGNQSGGGNCNGATCS